MIASHLALAKFALLLAAEPGALRSSLLRDVRRWMRSVTTRSLRLWLRDLQTEVDLPMSSVEALNEWLQIFPPDATPLDDPSDWGAYFVIGH